MGFRHIIAKAYQALSSWEFKPGELPKQAVLIGANHTSIWDGIFMVSALWDVGVPFRFLAKDSFFHGPFAPIIRAVGGIPVDRSHPRGMVGSIVDQLKKEEGPFYLVLAPEGTRSKVPYWKSGFYYIAKESGLPIVPCYIDSTTHTYGWKEAFYPTDDVRADMDYLREFYAPYAGMHPEKGTPPRLRIEDDPAH